MNKEISAEKVKELRDRTGVGLGKCKEALEAAQGDVELAIANLRKAGMASAVKKEGRETKEGLIKVKEKGDLIALVEVNAETDFVVKNDKFQQFAEDLVDEALHQNPSDLQQFMKAKYSKDPHITLDEFRAILVQTLGENIQVRRVKMIGKKKGSSYGFYSHQGGKLVSLVEIEGSDQEGDLAREIAMHVAAESPEYLSRNEVPESLIQQEKEIASAQIKGKPPQIVEKILEGKLQAYFDQVCLVNQKFVKEPDLSIQALLEREGKKKGKSVKISQFVRWKVGG